MRILVLGGTHFMGPFAVKKLAEAGHNIMVFHRGNSEADLPPEVEHLHGDRKNLPDHAAALRAWAPDVALDMLPMTEASARAVVETLRGAVGRLVAIGSQDVYRAYGRINGTEPGPPDPVPLTEESPLREKLYPYRGETPRADDAPDRWVDDYDKILVERVVMGDPHLPGTVLRLPAVYGPRDYQYRFWPWIKRMADRRPALFFTEHMARWRWSRGYVENVADAIALAVTDERAAGRIYNVCEPDALTEVEWARMIAEVTGWEGEIVTLTSEQLEQFNEFLPESLSDEGPMEQELVVDSSRIRQELGYTESVDRKEALRRTVEWELAHPPTRSPEGTFEDTAEDRLLSAIHDGG